MFCEKCGSEIQEGVAFCPNCGQPVAKDEVKSSVSFTEPEVTPAGNNFQEVDTKTERQGRIIANILRIAVLVAIVAVVIFAITRIVGKPYKKVVNQYVSAIEDKNAKKLLKLMPDVYIDYMKDKSGYSQKEIEEKIQDELENQFESLEDKVDASDKDSQKIKISIDDYEKIEKCDEDDLKDLQETIDNYTDEEGKVKVKKAYKIEVKIKVKFGEDEAKTSYNLSVGKVGGKWCIIS